jgi:hypothetical protein
MRNTLLIALTLVLTAVGCASPSSTGTTTSNALGGAVAGHAIQHVFIVLMENNNWSDIKGSSSAPYLNSLLTTGAHAEAYNNIPGIHPSLPNYIWLEAGNNFGVLADGDPSQFHQSTTAHLVNQLEAAGITWKEYAEDIDGTTCPLSGSGKFAPRHVPFLYFDDVTNNLSSSSARCTQHVRPYSELAKDIANNTLPQYAFITPNLCDDMHGGVWGCLFPSVGTGDTWLSQQMPQIINSSVFKQSGALFITWDESENGDFPIGMIVVSPFAKAGYSNSIPYSHSSTLRTMQEIFNVGPFLGDAANATDLSDLFSTFP